MQYQLVKKLQTVGFEIPASPQGEYYPFSMSDGSFDVVYIPTLEELVEMCGKEFTDIRDLENLQIHVVHPMEIDPEKKYEAVSTNQKPTKYGHGPTMHVAVANLYLALKDPLSSL